MVSLVFFGHARFTGNVRGDCSARITGLDTETAQTTRTSHSLSRLPLLPALPIPADTVHPVNPADPAKTSDFPKTIATMLFFERDIMAL